MMQDPRVVGKKFGSFPSNLFAQPFQYFQIVNLVDYLSSWYKFIMKKHKVACSRTLLSNHVYTVLSSLGVVFLTCIFGSCICFECIVYVYLLYFMCICCTLCVFVVLYVYLLY